MKLDLDGVNMISCGNTNCFVLRGENGDILIDTGIPDYRNEIEVWLHNYNVRLIVLTHGHVDHTGNAGYFAELLSAKTAMSADDVSLAENSSPRKFYPVGIKGHIMKAAIGRSKHGEPEHFDTDISFRTE